MTAHLSTVTMQKHVDTLLMSEVDRYRVHKRASSLQGTPFPKGEPLAMAQEGDSITLTCTEATSIPPANTTWRKGLQQEDMMPGLKYTLSEEGPALRLTIRNVSKDDEGVYFCRSENLLGVRELEVYLTVRSESGGDGHSLRTQ